jgi:hypothetical protein
MTSVEYPIGVPFSMPMGEVPSLPPPTGRVVSVRATRTLYGLNVYELGLHVMGGLEMELQLTRLGRAGVSR